MPIRSSDPTIQKTAVFLDRDGTIIEEVGYLDNIGQLKLIPGAARAIGLLNKAGIPVIMITNQSGVARGYFSESVVEQLHQRLNELLETELAYLDAIYYCPHHPTEGTAPYRRACNCRKPHPGMVEQAIDDLQLGKRRLFVVGDKLTDIELAKRAGAEGILVLTGYGREEKKQLDKIGKAQPAYIATDLLQAIQWIFSRLAVGK
ncbi:MAG: HAD family hydrolase [Deltaproteobacteria bacterium]|nr:HAD family hydrolase [Candidatus Tharpellaceae bacterium]